MTTPMIQSPLLHWSFPIRVNTTSSPTSCHKRFSVTASKSIKQKESNISTTSQEDDDVSFLLKLGGGSFAGAAAIKYGSILEPEITSPNIIQALLMISTPVVLAVLVLIYQSQSVER